MVETVFTDFEIGLKNNRSLGMSTKLFDGSLLYYYYYYYPLLLLLRGRASRAELRY